MDLPSLDANQARWNRLQLNVFWTLLVVSVAAELLYATVTPLPQGEFFRLYIVRPTLLIALIISLAELGCRLIPKHRDNILVTASALISLTIAAIHSSLDYLLFILFFPVLTSIFYFQFKKLLYAIGCTFASLVSLFLFNDEISARTSYASMVTICLIVGVFSLISLGVLARGREILLHLHSSFENNQELMVRNILMDKLAKTDALTESYNHMAFHEFIDHLVLQADKGLVSLRLAVLDIDNFKSVNDTFGHRAGDEVLRFVAAAIRSRVGEHDVVARYGGEEFAVVFVDRAFEEAYDTLETIRACVAGTRHEVLGGATVTISCGLNEYEKGMGKEAFFHGADAALYEAKHSGKNRIVIASGQEMQQSHLA